VADAAAITYSPYCTSATCRKAADAAAAASQKAAEASANANSLQGEIDKYTAEIAEIEARIAANEAMIADLEQQITETQEKLTRQRTALAKLTVKMYHEDNGGTTAIDILASSSSISDLTEKQSRQETIEEQITKSAKEVNETKQDLEQQQESVEAKLAENEKDREEAADKRAELDELQTKYEGDAAAYSADAEAQMQVMAAEISKRAAEISRYNSGGVVISGNDSYRALNPGCPGAQDTYYTFYGIRAYACECTSYASFKAYQKWGIHPSSAVWGNAKNWIYAAAREGYRVDRTAAPYTVAVSTSGTYGHVMWVESVNANGTINISEYNNPSSSASRSWGDYGARSGVSTAGLYFIHFD